MKNQRLVEALEEMNDARESAWSAWSVSSAYWSAIGSAYVSANLSAETNEKEVLEILKEKLNE